MAKGVDGAQRRGPVGGVEPEEHPDGHGHHERLDDRGRGHDRLDADDTEPAPIRPTTTPGDAAQQRQHHRLGQELAQDGAPGRADGLADADLAGAFGDGDQHDVHDPDAARPGG